MKRIIGTPSGRFEFFSQALFEKRKGGVGSSRDEAKFLRSFTEITFDGSEGEYPLLLYPFRLITNPDGRGSLSPTIQEMFGYYHRQYWTTWVEINPKLAKSHGLKDGQDVYLESAQGRIQCKVKVFEGAMPGVVNVPIGMGHSASGRFAKGIGENPMDLIIPNVDPLSGSLTLHNTRVRIVPAVKV